MAYTEKKALEKVLHRRGPLLVSFVDFNDDLQNIILRQGLLTKQQVKKILVSNPSQLHYLIVQL